MFSEFREKVLRSSKRLLGCYESTPGYTVFDEHFYGDATNFTLSSGGVTNAGINSNTTLDLPFFDEVSRISQLDSTPIECKESAAAMLEAGDNIAALMIQSMMSPEEDHAGSKDDPDSSLQEAIPSSRISLRANKGEKKNEFRRRWDDIMKRGQAILDSSSTSIPPLELDASKLSGTDLFNTTSLPLPLMASARYRPGKIAVDDSFNLHLELTFYSSITLATGNINKIRSLDNSGSLERSTAAEAQQLLDDALLMSQTYQLSSASQLKQQLGNVGCSGGVTTSEDPAESFRSLMGDLLKVLFLIFSEQQRFPPN